MGTIMDPQKAISIILDFLFYTEWENLEQFEEALRLAVEVLGATLVDTLPRRR